MDSRLSTSWPRGECNGYAPLFQTAARRAALPAPTPACYSVPRPRHTAVGPDPPAETSRVLASMRMGAVASLAGPPIVASVSPEVSLANPESLDALLRGQLAHVVPDLRRDEVAWCERRKSPW